MPSKQSASSRKREASSTAATVGPQTPFQTNAFGSSTGSSSADAQGRRPRELPWLVTPPPSVNHSAAIAAAAAGSQSRRSKPSTTPATATCAPDKAGGKGGQPWSASTASTTSGNQRDPHRRGTQNGKTGEAAAEPGGAGAGGQGTGEQVSRSLFPRSDQHTSSNGAPSGGFYDDEGAEEIYAAEAAAAAAAQEASEWARRRHEALKCAGSMEVPVGSSSSVATGSGAGTGGAEFSPVLLLGLGPSSVGGESLSYGGRGAEGDGESGRRSPPRGRGKVGRSLLVVVPVVRCLDILQLSVRSSSMHPAMELTRTHEQHRLEPKLLHW